MNPLDFALLTDENISPEVVAGLRERGLDVETATGLGLAGATDAALLECAASLSRVVVTHDADFGLLAIRQGVPFVGVIFLRPGHIRGSLVLEVVDKIRRADIDAAPPFLMVAEHRRDRILIRLRGEPW
jgi:predicted nuclease of predicted toxin-antitoxin system